MAEKTTAIAKLLNVLDEDKAVFETEIRNGVRSCIEQSNRGDCVGIIERKDSHGIALTFINLAWSAVVDESDEFEREYIVKESEDQYYLARRYSWKQPAAWVKRFIIMSKHKGSEKPRVPGHDGWHLESCLTLPIKLKIVEVWESFYNKRQDSITAGLIDMMESDRIIMQQLAMHLVAEIQRAGGKKMTKELQKSMVHFITQEVSGHLSAQAMHNIGGTIGHAVSHAATTAAGKALVAQVSAHLVHTLATSLAHMAAKHVGGIMMKTALATVGKAAITHQVLVGFTTALVALFAGHATAMVAWLLIPVIILFAGKQIKDFPKDLAAKIAPPVTQHIMGEYRSTNKSVIEKMFEQFVKKNVKTLAKKLAKETLFTDSLHEASEAHLQRCTVESIDLGDVEIIEVKEKGEDDDCVVM